MKNGRLQGALPKIGTVDDYGALKIHLKGNTGRSTKRPTHTKVLGADESEFRKSLNNRLAL